MAKNRGAKGAQFEREICRQLTKWATGKPKPELFWRTATSGAKATMEIQAGRTTHMGGDLGALHPMVFWVTDAFNFECKNRASFGVLPHFLLHNTKLFSWWAQCVADAEANNKIPWMVFKEKNSSVFTAVPVGYFTPPQGVGHHRWLVIQPPVGRSFMVTTLDYLLEANPFEDVRKRMLFHEYLKKKKPKVKPQRI